MSFDREDTLKKAEKLLRQGKLEPAIAEYQRVVEQDPGDWITSNTLGDLYVRAGKPDLAAAQYGRIAEHFMLEGFLPKAAALYKKLLKLNPDDETTPLTLAEISQRQGLLADAKAYLNTIAGKRRARGDRAGEADIVVRLGSVDPNDFEARLLAARTLGDMGDEDEAAAAFRRVYEDLVEKDRPAEALAALREAVARNPHDQDGRIALARAAIGAGDLDGARSYLDRDTAGSDPELLLAVLEIGVRGDQLDEVRQVAGQVLGLGRDRREQVVDLAWSMAGTRPEAAFALVDAVVDHDAVERRYADAAGVLQDFVERVPAHVPALLRLIDVAVDGGLEPTMNEAQAHLADAYLDQGHATEGRVIAEDLVAREPWEHAHIERFRRALVLLKVSQPDLVIAERLSGESPFIATDVFAPAPQAAAMAQPSPAEVTADAEPTPSSATEPPLAVSRFERSPDFQPIPLSSSDANLGGDEIDLNGVLGSTRVPPRDEAPSLADAFSSMRQGGGRRGAPDLSAQQMTLARTYIEMGLPDQAVEPLIAAAKAPSLRFEAASILGRMYRDRGDVPQAAEWLERAAEAPAPTLADGRAIAYDLADALEATGETSRALAIFLEIQADDGEFRDVAVRVARLTRVETETGG